MARNLNEAGKSARFVYLIELAGKQQILIMKLHSEGKIIEARDHMSQLNRFSDMIKLLNTELQKQQEHRQREQMSGASYPLLHTT